MHSTGNTEGETDMPIYPKSLELPDGTMVVIKKLSREDFEFSLGFFRRQPEEDRIYLQRDVTKREVIERRMGEIEEGMATVLIAIADGMVVADCSLYAPLRGWFRYTGEVRIVVDVNYRGRGLGSALLREMITVAGERGLKKLEASYMDTQKGIGKTLSNLGFEEEGALKEIVVDLKGYEHDLTLLGRSV